MRRLAGPPGGRGGDRLAEVQQGSGSRAAEDGAQGARGLQEDGQVEHPINKGNRTGTRNTHTTWGVQEDKEKNMNPILHLESWVHGPYPPPFLPLYVGQIKFTLNTDAISLSLSTQAQRCIYNTQ